MHNWPNGLVSKVLIHLWWKRQIVVDSAGNGSNLNCSCLIVCSLFFQKIIYRYISIYLIIETPKNSKIQPLGRNGQARRFDHILWIRTNFYAFLIFLAIFNHFPSVQNEFFCEGPTIFFLQYYTKSFL